MEFGPISWPNKEIPMARETRIGHHPGAAIGDGATGRHASVNGIFRKEGEYWTVGIGGNSFRLKDTKGLGYLAHLLRHPGAEFHVLDLAGGIAGQQDAGETGQSEHGLPRVDEELEKAGIHITNLGDAGEMLDEQAKVAYRRRLSELREELEEAKEREDFERAGRAEQELEALTRELSRAVGLGGRNRRAGSASERARQSIGKSVKTVLERITQNDAALGDVLARCIRTGTFCSYQPDPDFPIAWEFAATTITPPERPTPSGNPPPAPADRSPSLPVVPEVSPFSLAERTAFVGREAERSLIRKAIDRALDGHGSLVMLGGGPGVGKSRLAMEMGEYAARVGFQFLVGRCYERDEPFPYSPIVEIIESDLVQASSPEEYRRLIGESATEIAQIVPSLRRVFPDIPQPLDLPPTQARRHLFQSIAEGLGRMAQTRSYVFVVEDLHWADESTLALLIHLASRISQFSVVSILTYRDEYTENNPAFVRTLEELIRMGTRPLRLGGLSRDGVAQMLRELSGRQPPESLVKLIFEESQGYPFFVEEVYRHLVEDGKLFDTAGQFRTDINIAEIDVPENVRLIISRRLEKLHENEKLALMAAAVIGRSFSFQLLTAVSQIDVDELFTVVEKAQQMGIIVPSSEGPETPFTFAHELVRQTLLAGTSAPRRQRLHARVAEAIEGLNPDAAKERAGEITDHLIKAGSFADREELVRWQALAGKSALEAAAFEEARNSFRSALSRIDEKDSRRRAELLDSMGFAERGLGRWTEAFNHWEEALDIYTKLEDRDGIARTCFRATGSAFWSGRWRKAFEIAERSIALLPSISRDRALVLASLGVWTGIVGEFDRAYECFGTALAVAEEFSDDSLRKTVLSMRSEFGFFALSFREVLDDSGRSAELPPESSRWTRVERLFWRQNALYHLGRIKEAAEIDEELKPLVLRLSYVSATPFYRQLSVWTEFWKEPDLDRLAKSARRALDANIEAGLMVFISISREQLSIAEFFRGDWDQALHSSEQAWPFEAPAHFKAINIGLRFRLRAYAGDRDAAFALVDQIRELCAHPGEVNTYGSWALALLAIEGWTMLGEREDAAALYPVVREIIATGTVSMVFISRFPQTVAGIAAAAARDYDGAEAHFKTAMQQAESFPNLLEQAEIRRFHAMTLMDRAASADREKAGTLLSEALETYTHIGMPRHIDMIRALLERAATPSE
jgi:tetratricopeptide (TPR) repeat protein